MTDRENRNLAIARYFLTLRHISILFARSRGLTPHSEDDVARAVGRKYNRSGKMVKIIVDTVYPGKRNEIKMSLKNYELQRNDLRSDASVEDAERD